jgi:hypothetical protein
LSGNTAVAGTQDAKTIAGLFAPTPDQDALIQHQQKLAKAVFRTPPSNPASMENTIVIIDGPSSQKDTEGQENKKETERGQISRSTEDTLSV